ncbi:MAG: FHA domain-containing protein [Rhodocyclaceae bacterium]|jgi:hypothetical protein|nr:FHA domain-containing protein [Rhodocyclaceae bacterium]
MPKLILSMDGLVLKEIPLVKERTTIGRKAHNDIQIDNLAISGEHAAITRILDDAFLEDRNSTNGTYVNGQPVKKHVLKHNDLIELGKYRLKFIADSAQAAGHLSMRLGDGGQAGPAANLAERDGPAVLPPSGVATSHAPVGVIRLLSGANAGRELVLSKAVTTLGKPGVQVAVLTRRQQGYLLSHGEGDGGLAINGQGLTAGSAALKDHDIIEIAGIRMEFLLKPRD